MACASASAAQLCMRKNACSCACVLKRRDYASMCAQRMQLRMCLQASHANKCADRLRLSRQWCIRRNACWRTKSAAVGARRRMDAKQRVGRRVRVEAALQLKVSHSARGTASHRAACTATARLSCCRGTPSLCVRRDSTPLRMQAFAHSACAGTGPQRACRGKEATSQPQHNRSTTAAQPQQPTTLPYGGEELRLRRMWHSMHVWHARTYGFTRWLPTAGVDGLDGGVQILAHIVRLVQHPVHHQLHTVQVSLLHLHSQVV
jgi:hypothetical protein